LTPLSGGQQGASTVSPNHAGRCGAHVESMEEKLNGLDGSPTPPSGTAMEADFSLHPNELSLDPSSDVGSREDLRKLRCRLSSSGCPDRLKGEEPTSQGDMLAEALGSVVTEAFRDRICLSAVDAFERDQLMTGNPQRQVRQEVEHAQPPVDVSFQPAVGLSLNNRIPELHQEVAIRFLEEERWRPNSSHGVSAYPAGNEPESAKVIGSGFQREDPQGAPTGRPSSRGDPQGRCLRGDAQGGWSRNGDPLEHNRQ